MPKDRDAVTGLHTYAGGFIDSDRNPKDLHRPLNPNPRASVGATIPLDDRRCPIGATESANLDLATLKLLTVLGYDELSAEDRAVYDQFEKTFSLADLAVVLDGLLQQRLGLSDLVSQIRSGESALGCLRS